MLLLIQLRMNLFEFFTAAIWFLNIYIIQKRFEIEIDAAM